MLASGAGAADCPAAYSSVAVGGCNSTGCDANGGVCLNCTDPRRSRDGSGGSDGSAGSESSGGSDSSASDGGEGSVASHVCVCFPGRTGPRCADHAPPCAGVTCDTTSSCNATTGRCECVAGYTPATGGSSSPACVRIECAPGDCGPHGACADDGRSCICEAGWSSATCALARCKHGGVFVPETYACNCTATRGGATCEECARGFTGPDCDTPAPCGGRNCGHGTCVNDGDGDGTACECDEEWSGDNCDKMFCNEPFGTFDACAGACTCVPPNTGSDCGDCEEGHYSAGASAECLIDQCTGIVCENDGLCDPADGVCTCKTGHGGPRCAVACLHGGTYNAVNASCDCVSPFAGATCAECVPGLMGPACNVTVPPDACAGVDCGAHGNCTSASGRCVCRDGYTGDSCAVAPTPTPTPVPSPSPSPTPTPTPVPVAVVPAPPAASSSSNTAVIGVLGAIVAAGVLWFVYKRTCARRPGAAAAGAAAGGGGGGSQQRGGSARYAPVKHDEEDEDERGSRRGGGVDGRTAPVPPPAAPSLVTPPRAAPGSTAAAPTVTAADLNWEWGDDSYEDA